jgi:hypothetical protein
MRAASRRAVSALLIRGQVSAPASVISVTAFSDPPMIPSGETSLATIQSQPLRARFSVACRTTSSVSAAKPTTSAGRPSAHLRHGGEDVWVLGETQRRQLAGTILLDLLPRRVLHPPVRHGGGEDGGIGGQGGPHGRGHLGGGFHPITSTPGGGGTLAGPVTKLTRAPRSRSAAASAVPCAPEERLAM